MQAQGICFGLMFQSFQCMKTLRTVGNFGHGEKGIPLNLWELKRNSMFSIDLELKTCKAVSSHILNLVFYMLYLLYLFYFILFSLVIFYLCVKVKMKCKALFVLLIFIDHGSFYFRYWIVTEIENHADSKNLDSYSLSLNEDLLA